METLKIIAQGRVQGVGFRNFIKNNAIDLQIKGVVKNLSNGDVEIIAEGEEKNIVLFIDICKQGPKYSDVKNLEIEKIQFQDFKHFEIK